jgi:hypothetical protein
MLENVKDNVSKLFIPIYKEEFTFSTQPVDEAIKEYPFIEPHFFIDCDAISSFESEGKENFLWISPEVYTHPMIDRMIIVAEASLTVCSKILENNNVGYTADNINTLKYLMTYFLEVLLPVFGIEDINDGLDGDIDNLDNFNGDNSI